MQIWIFGVVLFCVCLVFYKFEVLQWLARIRDRFRYFKYAQRRAMLTGLPLMVVGDPYGGMTNSKLGRMYGCGDVTVDIRGSRCPNTISGDLTTVLKKMPSNSHVIFVSFVLEYVPDLDKCIQELYRVSGGWQNLFVTHIQPLSKYARYKWSSGKNCAPTRNIVHTAPPISQDIKYEEIA